MATWDEEMTALADAVNDELSVSVTYRAVTPGAMDETTGKRAVTTSDTTVNACRLRSSVFVTEAKKRIEQTRWIIAVAGLAAADTNDRIIHSGRTYTIVSVGRSCDGKCWEIMTECGAN